MPLALQAKLLRFLQDRVIERVGGRQEIPVDVRVVCATNQDLQALIAEQRFRQDLYFRIGEVTIDVPPLRERRGAPTVLAHAMLRKFGGRPAAAQRGFTEDATRGARGLSWPGNVRELENKVKTALIMSEGPTDHRRGSRAERAHGRVNRCLQSEGSAHARRTPGDRQAWPSPTATSRAPPSCSA